MKYKYINLEDNIADVIQQYPETSEVFLSYGLHCVGCFANVFDTIEAGCEIHGMGDEEKLLLIKDVNLIVEKNEKKKNSSSSSR